MGIWMPYHNLGREVFLTPARFDENGTLFAGLDGATDESYEIKGDFVQNSLPCYTFENTDSNIDWCYLRKPDLDNYELSKDKYILKGTELTLDDVDSPTFMALRQRHFNMTLTTDVEIDYGYAGVTMYMCEDEHYDLFIRKKEDCYEAVLKLNIGGIKHEQAVIPLDSNKAKLKVIANNYTYNFFIVDGDKEIQLGYGNTKYLTSEVSGGFTGTMTGIFAVGNNTAKFTNFDCSYN